MSDRSERSDALCSEHSVLVTISKALVPTSDALVPSSVALVPSIYIYTLGKSTRLEKICTRLLFAPEA